MIVAPSGKVVARAGGRWRRTRRPSLRSRCRPELQEDDLQLRRPSPARSVPHDRRAQGRRGPAMKGAPRTLHIRCGNDIRDKLAEAGFQGHYLSFADPAWLGPPPQFNAWVAGRAALVAERTGLPRQKVRDEMGDAYWRLARAPSNTSASCCGSSTTSTTRRPSRACWRASPAQEAAADRADRDRPLPRREAVLRPGPAFAGAAATLWPRRKRVTAGRSRPAAGLGGAAARRRPSR